MKNVPKRKRSFILHKVKSGGGGGVEGAKSNKSKGSGGANASASANKSDSDDSIGSASDLRAREEQEEADEKEDSETMTVNDSVLTCGSSAYHAECESMAREELPSQCCRRGYPRMADLPENKEVDSLFGHSYGERPLLADDELDKGDTVSPAPLIDMNDDDGHPPPPRQPGAKSRASKAAAAATANDEDVFSMAPFKVLKKRLRDDDDDDEEEDEASQQLQQNDDDDFLITMSPPVTEGSLLDLGEAFVVPGVVKSTPQAQPSQSKGPETRFAAGDNVVGDNNPFSAAFSAPSLQQQQQQQQVGLSSEDLFGAVPFDRMAVSVSVSNSSRNSNEIDDFISFGVEKPADEFAKGVYEYPSRTSTASGIHNMSFEDLPAGSAADYVEFGRSSSYGKMFFQPAKSNNPFS